MHYAEERKKFEVELEDVDLFYVYYQSFSIIIFLLLL